MILCKKSETYSVFLIPIVKILFSAIGIEIDDIEKWRNKEIPENIRVMIGYYYQNLSAFDGQCIFPSSLYPKIAIKFLNEHIHPIALTHAYWYHALFTNDIEEILRRLARALEISHTTKNPIAINFNEAAYNITLLNKYSSKDQEYHTILQKIWDNIYYLKEKKDFTPH